MPTFTALSSAWLFLLIIPVVIFYFLKLRRTQQVVPSLVLWRQVLADQRVNSPVQRFKRNTLLLLQLLLLILLVLAAMQPVLRRGESNAFRLPILIDHSASMAALDRAGGESRLDVAKKRVRDVIEHLPHDQEVSLIAFARTARRLTGFTNNKAELREALEALQPEEVAGDPDDALRLAQGLARTTPFDRVLMISDGNFPARSQVELSFRIDYQRVPAGGSNFGITACNARRDLGGEWEVFVQLSGSEGAESTTGTVELWNGSTQVGRERVTLAKGGARRFSFRMTSREAADLEVRYLPEGFDSLASDNRAWLHLPAARPLSVFAREPLAAARHALSAIPGIELYPAAGGATQAGYDLVFADRPEDAELPARVLCTLGYVPAELQPLVRIESVTTTAIDWRRDSPLLQHVSLEEVIFADGPHTVAEPSVANFPERGFTVLAEGQNGPLLLEKSETDRHSVHALFHPDRSTLIYRVAFPVFVSNLVQTALRRNQLSEVEAARTGVLPALTLAANQRVRIASPGGTEREENTGASGRLSGIAAPRVGTYVIRGAGEPVQIGAALLSAMETSLASVEQLEFADQLKVKAASAPVKTDRALWWLLSCVALFVLALEWWWFNRPTVRG